MDLFASNAFRVQEPLSLALVRRTERPLAHGVFPLQTERAEPLARFATLALDSAPTFEEVANHALAGLASPFLSATSIRT